MTDPTPQVSEARTQGFGALIIFSDGVRAFFEGYSHGMGYGCEGLRRVRMTLEGKVIFEMNSRLYRVGPQEDEHRIVTIDPAYTQQRIATYIKSAQEYLDSEYLRKKPENKELWFPWVLLCSEGDTDYQRLENGEMRMLNK